MVTITQAGKIIISLFVLVHTYLCTKHNRISIQTNTYYTDDKNTFRGNSELLNQTNIIVILIFDYTLH